MKSVASIFTLVIVISVFLLMTVLSPGLNLCKDFQAANSRIKVMSQIDVAPDWPTAIKGSHFDVITQFGEETTNLMPEYNTSVTSLPWGTPLSEPIANPALKTEDASSIAHLNQGRNMTILFWNTFMGEDPDMYGTGVAPFVYHQCPVHNCKLTRDHSTQSSADAILFVYPGVKDLPDQRNRLPHQKYIMLAHESQSRGWFIRFPREARGIFNLTMTFRLDSDIPHPYGVMESINHLNNESSPPTINQADGKKKLVAWVASNCNTKSARGAYVRALQRHLPVDAYGRCGNLTCARGKHSCLPMIADTYKFYLSFENSICDDYITEKLYGMLGLGAIVPVVMGGANYSRLLPPGSYIDVRNFTSAEHLASYLKELDANDELYNAYFLWRRFYRVTANQSWMGPMMYCRVCGYLQKLRDQKRTYTDIAEWWYGPDGNQCLQNKDYYEGHVHNLSEIVLR